MNKHTSYMELFNVFKINFFSSKLLRQSSEQVRSASSGQAALIIILVTTVVITITVSTVGRTVTDVRSSTQTAEAYQALNAAEAGLEKVLLEITNSSDPTNLTSNCPDRDNACTIEDTDGNPTQSNYWYEMKAIPGSDDSYDLGFVQKGDTRTIWLVSDPYDTWDDTNVYYNHSGGDNNPMRVRVEWAGNATFLNPVYFELLVISSDASGDIYFNREVRKAPSGESISTINPHQFLSQPVYVKVRPINRDFTNVQVSDYNPNFPNQGVFVDIRGQYLGSGEGDQTITKRLNVTRWYDDIPPILDYVIYSNGSVEK